MATVMIIGGKGSMKESAKGEGGEEYGAGDSEGREEDMNAGAEAKKEAVRSLFAAMSRKDVQAGIEALEAFFEAC